VDQRDRDRLYVVHIIDSISRIFEYSQRDKDTFLSSRLVQDAVIRNLQTLAESAQRLSEEVKGLEPSVPWRSISGFRNVVVHEYLALDPQVIWLVIERDLPSLNESLQRIQEHLR
jgi:uncharacterized protein with HEPN domain